MTPSNQPLSISPSREEGHTLPELRPTDAMSGDIPRLAPHQDETDVDGCILQTLQRQPPIDQLALGPAVETLHHLPADPC